MAREMLIVRYNQLSGLIRSQLEPGASRGELAQAVREFLQQVQPWLAERVQVVPGRDCALVVPRRPATGPARLGERGPELLRAIEGALGMEDTVRELPRPEELAELEVPPPRFEPRGVSQLKETGPQDPLLRSRVRYFPLPRAEWFEICEGILTLELDRIAFEPWRPPGLAEEGPPPGQHAIRLDQITHVRPDTWMHIPCLRAETESGAYRYGWPAALERIEDSFRVSEWVATLRRLLKRRREI